jgi:hypothetical protein
VREIREMRSRRMGRWRLRHVSRAAWPGCGRVPPRRGLPYAPYVLADLAEAALATVMPEVAADAATAEEVARKLGCPQFAPLAALAGAAAALAVGRHDMGAGRRRRRSGYSSVAATRPFGRAAWLCWGAAN